MSQQILDLSELAESKIRELGRDLTLDHSSQVDFLTAAHSLDVQAVPGSGKTTLTALKLCAIARGWRSRERGICVLSHTNVAWKEISGRLQNDRFGRSILRPPHFIGTIQGFVDTFLGLPFARSQRMNVRFIDNDTYATEALRRFDNWARLSTLRGYLSRRQNGRDLVASASYAFDGEGQLSVRPAAHNFPADPATRSYREYTSLKESMADDGYFRFQDMYAFARQLLHLHPEVAEAVAIRFPWVIIDEMQDTSADQQDLLDEVFPADRVVVQRIGDENQRIFVDAESAGFPSADALELPVSRRFGSRIAQVVGSLTIRQPQEVLGSPERDDGHLLMILFDEATATQVIPCFAIEAESRLQPDLADEAPLKVVAARIGSSQAKRFPQTLQSYVPDYRPEPTVAAVSVAGPLIKTVRRAQEAAAAQAQREAVGMLWDALATVTDLCGVTTARGRLTGARLRRLVRNDSLARELDTRRLLRHLLEDAVTDSREEWERSAEQVHNWDLVATADCRDRAIAYCEYADAPTESVQWPDRPDLPPSIAVQTVHSVKGETHSGTLVLECLDKNGAVYDLVEALKLITGREAPSALSVSAKAACQLAFVAASRPRSMLALALLADHAEPYLDELHDQGWQVVDLR